MNHVATSPPEISPSVLLIYTGGTIGMIENPSNGVLEAFDFEYIGQHVPEIKRFGYRLHTISFHPVMDSSDMGPKSWIQIADVIQENYDHYDGFVVLHGTDTMAYTASALSFMLQGLAKPIVFTGAQLPIGKIRTDGKENLITSLEIAASRDDQGNPCVSEVCVFFNSLLLRGNRTTKVSADRFDAFASPNFPPLAQVGISIHFNKQLLRPYTSHTPKPLNILRELETNVTILKIFPGISRSIVHSILTTEGLRAVVLETYGSGNAPSAEWLISEIRTAIEKGIIVVNVTQCSIGTVEMQRYDTGIRLLQAGVITGRDSTTEAVVTKLMILLGTGLSTDEVKHLMQADLAGEITTPDSPVNDSTLTSIPLRKRSSIGLTKL